MSDHRNALKSAQISEGTMDKVLAWHFLADDGRMQFGRRPKVVVGKVYSLAKNRHPALCAVGFHGSVRAIDALQYAPGARVCRVNIWGDVQTGDDKLVGRHREVIPALTAAPLHVGEWDRGRWRPACEVWAMFVPKSYPKRQRASTNGGRCRACVAALRAVQGPRS